jgi:hypothetical protein
LKWNLAGQDQILKPGWRLCVGRWQIAAELFVPESISWATKKQWVAVWRRSTACATPGERMSLDEITGSCVAA